MGNEEWRFTDPEVGQWVEVKHKGVCQYIGPSSLSTHKYIDRNGTTHGLGNYGWRPLPQSAEEVRLRKEVERLRDKLSQIQDYLVSEGLFEGWMGYETEAGGAG